MSIKRDKNTGRFVKGNKSGKIFKKGDKLSEETKGKMKGRIPWNKGKGLSKSILVERNNNINNLEVIKHGMHSRLSHQEVRRKL